MNTFTWVTITVYILKVLAQHQTCFMSLGSKMKNTLLSVVLGENQLL